VRALRDFLLAPPGPGAQLEGGAARGGLAGPSRRGRVGGGDGVRRSRAADITAGPGLSGAIAGFLLRGPEPTAPRPEPAVADPGLTMRSEPAAPDRPTDLAAPFAAGAPLASSAILCAPEDARAFGVAAAALIARRSGAGCAVVSVWTAPEPHRHPEARPPASRAARRLAGALSARGLDALACGRAAVVALPPDPADAVACAGRAAAASGAAPSVLVLGGPRAAAFDDLLAGQELVLVVTRPGAARAIGALALAGLPAGGPPHRTCAVALGPVGRALAAGGLAIPAALRRALEAGEEPAR
jgi:hypothetical protein